MKIKRKVLLERMHTFKEELKRALEHDIYTYPHPPYFQWETGLGLG
jgi:hypothetical protein